MHHWQLQRWKERPPMEKTGLQWRNPREVLEIHLWLVASLEKVERQLLVLEMMVPQRGSLTSLTTFIFDMFHKLSVGSLDSFCSYHWPIGITFLKINSAESGSEGSSDASDENTNQQVCVFLFLYIYMRPLLDFYLKELSEGLEYG